MRLESSVEMKQHCMYGGHEVVACMATVTTLTIIKRKKNDDNCLYYIRSAMNWRISKLIDTGLDIEY